MTRRNYSLLIVVSVSILLSLLYCPPFDIFFDDKEIFKYGGFLIKKGNILYKDFFDHKPPLIFFINYLGVLLGDWGLWVIDTLLVLFASLQFLKLNSAYEIQFPWALPVLFNLILRNHFISFGNGMTREYTTVFLLIGFCITLSQSKYKWYLIGLITAIIFFFQQEQVIILIPFILYSLYADRLKGFRWIKSIISFSGGFITVLLPLLFYFYFNGALKDFWYCAFVFNNTWYINESHPGIIRQLITIKNYTLTIGLGALILLSVIMAIVSIVSGHKQKVLVYIGLLCIPLALISEFLSAKLAIGNATCIYYFLPLAATLPILFFIVFAFSEKNLFKHPVHQIIYNAFIIASLVTGYAVYVANYHKYPQDLIARSSEVKYLDTKKINDYELYVFGNSNYVYAYNHFKVQLPSKWMYHYFWSWYPKWDSDGQILQSIIKDLQTHKTRLIIYNPETMHFQSTQNQTKWESFLEANYQKLPGLIVYERK
jgi:hypothetical protein